MISLMILNFHILPQIGLIESSWRPWIIRSADLTIKLPSALGIHIVSSLGSFRIMTFRLGAIHSSPQISSIQLRSRFLSSSFIRRLTHTHFVSILSLPDISKPRLSYLSLKRFTFLSLSTMYPEFSFRNSFV